MKMAISKREWVFLLVFGGAMTWVMTRPLAVCVQRADPEVMRKSNLRSIATLLYNYSLEHNEQYAKPNEFQLVMDWADIPSPEPVLGSDEYQDDIWMCPIPWDDRRTPIDSTQVPLAKIPMLHERVDLSPDGIAVAFWDRSIRLLSNEEFAELVNAKESICLGCQLLGKDTEP